MKEKSVYSLAAEMVGRKYSSSMPCLEFVLEFFRKLGKKCPVYNPSSNFNGFSAKKYFTIVKEYNLLDVLLLDCSYTVDKLHLGIYLGNGTFIHNYDTSVVITHLTESWRRKIRSIWRPKENG